MDHRLAEVLDRERRKLELLRAKVGEQERRVQILEALSDDPLDALLERELQAKPAAPTAPAAPVQTPVEPTSETPAAESAVTPAAEATLSAAEVFVWGGQPRQPRRVPASWVKLLRYIGAQGRNYDEVKSFIHEYGLQISEGAVRTGLMNYRKDYGFVENPRKGYYKATARALEFIARQEGEAPALPGGEPQSQPVPLTRAAA